MEQLPMRTRLQPGQSLRMMGETGMTILSAKGKVRVLAAPEWLGDQILRSCVSLHEGDAHQVERGGWIEIVACGEAEVLAIPVADSDASMIARIALFLRKQFGRWTRTGQASVRQARACASEKISLPMPEKQLPIVDQQ